VIFEGAENAYVWLSHHNTSTLQILIARTETLASEIEETLSASHLAGHGSQETSLAGRKSWVQSVISTLEAIYSDPWFTSLWTLQETFLRQDAILLSLEAEAIHLGPTIRDVLSKVPSLTNIWPTSKSNKSHAANDTFWTIGSLAATCAYIYGVTLEHHKMIAHQWPDSDLSQLEQLMHIINKSGFNSLDSENPLSLYPVSGYRETEQSLDRIYAIMQIFDLQLGQSAQPDRQDFSLEELEDQLGEALLDKYRLLSQLFVHHKAAEPGKCWRIGQHSEMVDSFMPRMLMDNSPYCAFWKGDLAWGLHFQSKAYSFKALFARWFSPARTDATYSALECRWTLDQPSIGPLRALALDETEVLREMPTRFKSSRLTEGEQHKICSWLALNIERDNNLRVLLLGHFVEDVRAGPYYHCMGLIVLRQTHSQCGEYWQRIGICLWRSNLLPLRGECGHGKWETLKGLCG
jgi:hypothetical protein